MVGLQIIKASAGSGKTHRLAEEYIGRLIKGDDGLPAREDAYRHILAVTFTNKATDEMKSRVIENLYALSKSGKPEAKQASRILTAILHDYSGFSISTIDRFFQGVMRAFAREIGEFASYKVELDSNQVLDHAVDLMMASLEDPSNADLFGWLREYSISQIESGEKWDVTSSLKQMAGLFLKEDFKLSRRRAGTGFGDRGAITTLRGEMEEMVRQFESDLVALGKRGVAIMERHSLDYGDFKGGQSKSPFIRFVKLAKGEYPRSDRSKFMTKTFLDLPDNLNNWCTKTSPRKADIEAAYHGGLNDAVTEVAALLGPGSSRLRHYNTALMLRDKLYITGIFSDLYARMHEYLKENNTILLSETAEVLGKIIDGSDTPFIYEKTGTRYDNYMLDEFQDTSRLQWEAFRPLLSESIASGHSDLIVGDIKQSIYRWRGADLTLLGEDLEREFPAPSSNTDTLHGNWRSASNIVGFNTDFYLRVGDLLSGSHPNIAPRIKEFYADSRQDVMRTEAGSGYVKVIFLPRKREDDSGREVKWKEAALEMTGPIVESLRKRYDLPEITFLVRKNSEGALVAAKLISLGYEVVTEDSLNIASSLAVRKIAALLKHQVNPDDDVNNQILAALFGGAFHELDLSQAASVDASLYGLCESLLSQVCAQVSRSDTPFVTAFMDSVLSYMDRYGSDLAGFVEWWENVGCRKSISAPEGSDAIRVMTIHKAKGLKSGAVVLPFLESKLSPSGLSNDYIWCTPSEEPFSKVGVVPVKMTSALEDTVFSEEYKREKLGYAVDAVNTAYVAMTRAVGDMVIIAPAPENENKCNSVSDLLYQHLRDEISPEGVYELGTPDEVRLSSEPAAESIRMKDYATVPLSGRLSVSLRGDDYYDREAGIVRHDILARIDTAEDVGRAVESAVNAEELDAAEREKVSAEMEGYLASVAGRHWFDGTYAPLNEVSIVDADGEVHRPDRVLVEKGMPVGQGRAIVIDYKFGQEKSSYRNQVRKYMELLSQIGYRDVTGYIWYCKLNKVEECV